MSDCGCKSGKVEISNIDSKKELNVKTINSYIFKFFLFLISVCLLPLALVPMIVVLFKTIVLNNNINLLPLLIKIGQIFQLKEKDIDEDNEEINPEELELIGVDEIKIPKTTYEDRERSIPN